MQACGAFKGNDLKHLEASPGTFNPVLPTWLDGKTGSIIE